MIEDETLPLKIKPILARGCRLEADTLQIPEGQIKMAGTGAEIVRLCDGQRTVGEIIHALSEKYAKAEPKKIKEETIHFLQRLNERAVLLFQ